MNLKSREIARARDEGGSVTRAGVSTCGLRWGPICREDGITLCMGRGRSDPTSLIASRGGDGVEERLPVAAGPRSDRSAAQTEPRTAC